MSDRSVQTPRVVLVVASHDSVIVRSNKRILKKCTSFV